MLADSTPQINALSCSNNRTNFLELNDDCKLLILEELDIASLIEMAEINQNIGSLSADVYRRKFSHKGIEIREPFWLDDSISENENGMIQLRDMDIITRVFRLFGQSIVKLKIQFWKNHLEQVRQTIALASQYCDSLIHFELKSFDEDVLKNVTKPFVKVETVSFDGQFSRLASDTLSLNEMFPNMRNLLLQRAHIDDKKSVILSFPHLRHLQLDFLELYAFTNEQILNLTRLNPHIRSVNLQKVSMTFIKLLSESLPNLESLELVDITNWPFSEDIHFQSIDRLRIASGYSRFATSVTIDRLQEIVLDWCSFPDGWMQFIQKHPTLTEISIFGDEMSDTDLSSLIGNVPNLVEAGFTVKQNFTPSTIIRFVKSSTNLKRLILSFHKVLDNSTFEKIEKGIKDEWTVTNALRNYFFVKKML